MDHIITVQVMLTDLGHSDLIYSINFIIFLPYSNVLFALCVIFLNVYGVVFSIQKFVFKGYGRMYE